VGQSGSKLPYRFCPLPADGRRRLAYSDLPARAYKVLMAILGMTLERLDADGRRKTWTRSTDATIAAQCGLCDRSVRRALSDLEHGSWIQRVYRDDRNARRELRLGAAVIEMWGGERAEAEIRAGQQLLPFDRPELPGPSKAVALPPRPRTSGVQVLRLAVGAEGLQELPTRTDLSGLSGQICPPVLIITENVHRSPPPPVRPQCAVSNSEEEDVCVLPENTAEDTAPECPAPAGKGLPCDDLKAIRAESRPGREKGATGLELRNLQYLPAFWSGARTCRRFEMTTIGRGPRSFQRRSAPVGISRPRGGCGCSTCGGTVRAGSARPALCVAVPQRRRRRPCGARPRRFRSGVRGTIG
jgi:hypothetical protein